MERTFRNGLTVTLTCSLQEKSEETVIPKSLTCFTLLRLAPNEYVERERSRLRVIRKTSHLPGLKRSCHLDAQDSSWSTSSCRSSLSLALFDSSLYTLVASANILNVEEILDDISLT